MTSLAFMWVEVPEPVWKTSIGNCPSWRPSAISLAARSMRAAVRFPSSPRSAWTAAAAPWMRPGGPLAGTLGPRAGEARVAGDVGEGVAEEVGGGGVGACRQAHAALGAEQRAGAVGEQPVEAGHGGGAGEQLPGAPAPRAD